jgi:hypothetical protein
VVPRVVVRVACNEGAPVHVGRQHERVLLDPLHRRHRLQLAAGGQLLKAHAIHGVVKLLGKVAVQVVAARILPRRGAEEK